MRGVMQLATSPGANQKSRLKCVGPSGDLNPTGHSAEPLHPPDQQPTTWPATTRPVSSRRDPSFRLRRLWIDSHCTSCFATSESRSPLRLPVAWREKKKGWCGGAAPLLRGSLAKFRRSVPWHRFSELRYSVGVHPLDPPPQPAARQLQPCWRRAALARIPGSWAYRRTGAWICFKALGDHLT